MDLNRTPSKRNLGATGTPSPKRVRKDLTLKDEINLIEESEKLPKVTQKDLSVNFGKETMTVSDIPKRKEFCRKQFSSKTKSVQTQVTIESYFQRMYVHKLYEFYDIDCLWMNCTGT